MAVMSYQVLARKWRPAKFSELVGQEHVKSAIINGLTQQRTHHAYLFSGTRGVGKTTIARIFAKSLNCEEGISAEPCGQCSVCKDVTDGRFVDLIEIDAASRTKVGDTREILDNVQYAPTRGRYKIYLIDEVHMLSRHSFNALLKTLEEPPEHVKFLFATTDPQKLPVTILSRCLQFNLQALSISQIETQLQHILSVEQIPFEPAALSLLARYAKGSMRDALSLTDQAIAQSGANITATVINQMLGTIDQTWSKQILEAIVSRDSDSLVAEFSRLAEQSPDISKLFDDLILLCHQAAMCQVLPEAASLNEENADLIRSLAQRLSPPEIQVYYQFLLQGKKELPYSSDAQTAFEMCCLRLLAFQPAKPEELEKKNAKENTVTPKTEDISKVEISNEKAPGSAQEETLAEETVEEEIDSKKQVDEELPVEAPAAFEPTPTQSSSSESVPADSAPVEAVPVESTPAESEYDPELMSLMQASQQGESQDDANDWHHQYSADDLITASPPQEHIETSASSQTISDDTVQSKLKAKHAPQVNAEFTTDAGCVDTNPVLAILASRGISSNGRSSTASSSSASSPNDISAKGHEDVILPTDKAESPAEQKPATVHVQESEPEAELLEPEPELLEPTSEDVRFAHQVDRWAAMIERSGLMGLGRQLALNCEVIESENHIELIVRQQFAHLLNEKSEAELRAAVSNLAPATEFVINTSELTQTAPADIQQHINQNRQERAEQSIADDPMVQTLTQEFDAKIIENSIKPL
jgi:DNA polymerase III subunit gamma/tau